MRDDTSHRYPRRGPREGEPLRAPWDPIGERTGRPRSNRASRQHLPRRSGVRRFIDTWGWRAYAIPVLLVVTILVVVDVIREESSASDQTPEVSQGAEGEHKEGTVVGAPEASADQVSSPGLPDGGEFTSTGAGTWHVIPGVGEQVGTGRDKVYTYTVEVEDGSDPAAYGGDEAFASMVSATLSNPKSWTADEALAFRRVEDPAQADFAVSLTTPGTVRELCKYSGDLEASCYHSQRRRVVINEARWVRGADSYLGDVGAYRQYLINHVTGYALGLGSVVCDQDGALAPVMMEQSFGLDNASALAVNPRLAEHLDSSGDGGDLAGVSCRPNAWPHPGA